jgi:hypothetical protein
MELSSDQGEWLNLFRKRQRPWPYEEAIDLMIELKTLVFDHVRSVGTAPTTFG